MELAALALILGGCAVPSESVHGLRGIYAHQLFEIEDDGQGSSSKRILRRSRGLEWRTPVEAVPLSLSISQFGMRLSRIDAESDAGWQAGATLSPNLVTWERWALDAELTAGYWQASAFADDVEAFESDVGVDLHYLPSESARLAVAPLVGAHLLYGDGRRDSAVGGTREVDYSAFYAAVGLEAAWIGESGAVADFRVQGYLGDVEGFEVSLGVRF